MLSRIVCRFLLAGILAVSMCALPACRTPHGAHGGVNCHGCGGERYDSVQARSHPSPEGEADHSSHSGSHDGAGPMVP